MRAVVIFCKWYKQYYNKALQELDAYLKANKRFFGDSGEARVDAFRKRLNQEYENFMLSSSSRELPALPPASNAAY